MAVASAGPYALRPPQAGVANYAAAKELAGLVDQQFAAVRGAGAGIAGGSCCAAVAVVPNPGLGWPAAVSVFTGAALPFAVVFGNSRLLGGGLALGVAGGHAERAALTAANGAGLVLWTTAANDALIYIELPPCAAGPGNPNCTAWLGLAGGAAAQPYAAAFPGIAVTLRVWVGFANVPAMAGHHALPLGPGGPVPNQLTTVAAW
jgi:hypothetical protein